MKYISLFYTLKTHQMVLINNGLREFSKRHVLSAHTSDTLHATFHIALTCSSDSITLMKNHQ